MLVFIEGTSGYECWFLGPAADGGFGLMLIWFYASISSDLVFLVEFANCTSN